MAATLEGGEWSAARPGRTLPPENTRYPLYRRLGGPQGRSGRAENLVPTGIWSRTVQPVVSRYTDWVIYHHHHHRHHHKHQGLDPLIRSVSTVTAARANASSVFQLFSFLVVCDGMISKGFGFVAFFASVKASSVCIHLSCLVCL